ncbi:AraC family transcriptional regulator [Bradyrhizobium sediminis]|uniref:AraC family transcriptional regulator n=1 Tax=Bradyrhizobium sediminis TaxID=2840469 RepID=A0A975RSP7_9BRAD|nr:AraC family transcriptional regulator [Bradyrhizobium sediminis]QWG13652.1 AraC family transcriptional regulator [Bradyrhizobium sediminis]QWG18825.1 AraC family transcriptional regulator [Bradyrhizobium sediminis]
MGRPQFPEHSEPCAIFSPRPSVAHNIFAGFVRDTRGRELAPNERFNFYPAFPFCVLTLFFEGAGFKLKGSTAQTSLQVQKPLPRIYLSGPQTNSSVIWNPSGVVSLSVGLYPATFAALSRCDISSLVDQTVPLSRIPNDEIVDTFAKALSTGKPQAAFDLLQDYIERCQQTGRLPHDDLGRSVQDWVHGIGRKASGLVTSLSARQAERRIKKWTGHSRRKLQFYQRAERLLEQTLAMGRAEPQWSAITYDAGFSDQSHMIRDMRRLTGFSPKSLFGRLEEEPFWCYRLFGSHFASLVRADSAP